MKAEEIYVAPEIEVEENVIDAIDLLIDHFSGLYAVETASPENSGSTLAFEFAKAAGHWAYLIGPLQSLSALLLESVEDFDGAGDLALDASGTVAACRSILDQITDVIYNVYRIQEGICEDKVMSSHIADQAEDMMQEAGVPLPDLQLDLFQGYEVIASNLSPACRASATS